MEIKSNYARFLVLIRILVDETRKEEPMSRAKIIRRCEEEGAAMNEQTFSTYLRHMAEGGIIIARKLPPGKDRGSFLYWYERGWI